MANTKIAAKKSASVNVGRLLGAFAQSSSLQWSQVRSLYGLTGYSNSQITQALQGAGFSSSAISSLLNGRQTVGWFVGQPHSLQAPSLLETLGLAGGLGIAGAGLAGAFGGEAAAGAAGAAAGVKGAAAGVKGAAAGVKGAATDAESATAGAGGAASGAEGAATGALEGVGAAGGLAALIELLDNLFKESTWIRVLEVIGGVILLIMGLRQLASVATGNQDVRGVGWPSVVPVAV